ASDRNFFLLFFVVVVSAIVGHHGEQRHAGVCSRPESARGVKQFAVALEIDADRFRPAVRNRGADRRPRAIAETAAPVAAETESWLGPVPQFARPGSETAGNKQPRLFFYRFPNFVGQPRL